MLTVVRDGCSAATSPIPSSTLIHQSEPMKSAVDQPPAGVELHYTPITAYSPISSASPDSQSHPSIRERSGGADSPITILLLDSQ